MMTRRSLLLLAGVVLYGGCTDRSRADNAAAPASLATVTLAISGMT
jgi:uncharacterized lipoprotein YajG